MKFIPKYGITSIKYTCTCSGFHSVSNYIVMHFSLWNYDTRICKMSRMICGRFRGISWEQQDPVTLSEISERISFCVSRGLSVADSPVPASEQSSGTRTMLFRDGYVGRTTRNVGIRAERERSVSYITPCNIFVALTSLLCHVIPLEEESLEYRRGSFWNVPSIFIRHNCAKCS